MTLHLLGLPHLDTVAENSWCAYTQRTRDFATMLTRAGEHVVLYGSEHNDAECEFVPLVTNAEQRKWWPNYEPRRDVFQDFDPAGPGWQAINARAAKEIRERAEPRDIVGITMGYAQRPAWEQIGRSDLLPVEVGCGYSGIWAPYRVYESKAWRDFLTGKYPPDDMRAFDTVIPRAWLAEQFPEGPGGDYLLYVGRLTARKGPHVASVVAERLGMKLKVAGQGVRSWSDRLIVCEDGTELRGEVEYLGVLGPRERAEVMGGAAAILTPTQYFEPLGGVSIEAQFTGTPAIVSNWGGLPENIIEGQTGFACDLLRDYCHAVEKVATLDRGFVREHALATWSTDAIAPRFLDYFARLGTLWEDGWYSR